MPQAWAVRSRVPKFCGSCRLSSARISGASAHDVVEVGVRERLGFGQHALVVFGRASVEPLAIGRLDADVAGAGLGKQLGDGRSLGDEHSMDAATGAQGLDDCVAAVEPDPTR